MRSVDLNDYLSIDNEWARRLLGMEPFQQQRTTELIEREHNIQHYGELLHTYRDNLDALRRKYLLLTDEEVFVSWKDSIFAVPHSVFVNVRRQYMKSTLMEYASDSIICELGAGFGQNFFWMNGDLYGGECSSNGVTLGKLLGFDLREFNFYEPDTYSFIRPGTTVFTSHAIEQVPDSKIVIDALRGIKDRINFVVHFEPLYRKDRRNLMGLLRNKYALINDYNRNLMDCLENDSEIEIVRLDTDVYGRNPLNPTSILVWKFI